MGENIGPEKVVELKTGPGRKPPQTQSHSFSRIFFGSEALIFKIEKTFSLLQIVKAFLMDVDAKEEEQDGMSVHSPCKAAPSSTSSLSKASLNVCVCVSASSLSLFRKVFPLVFVGFGCLFFG